MLQGCDYQPSPYLHLPSLILESPSTHTHTHGAHTPRVLSKQCHFRCVNSKPCKPRVSCLCVSVHRSVLIFPLPSSFFLLPMHPIFRYLGPELNVGYSFVQLVVSTALGRSGDRSCLTVARVSPSGGGGGGLGLSVRLLCCVVGKKC